MALQPATRFIPCVTYTDAVGIVADVAEFLAARQLFNLPTSNFWRTHHWAVLSTRRIGYSSC